MKSKKRSRRKVKILAMLAVVLMLCLGIVTTVHAATLSTIFGTMTYTLTHPASNQVNALTSMPASASTYSYVKTTLEVQQNSTGVTIFTASKKVNYQASTKITSEIKAINLTTSGKAAFSAHEVVGSRGYVKYLSGAF